MVPFVFLIYRAHTLSENLPNHPISCLTHKKRRENVLLKEHKNNLLLYNFLWQKNSSIGETESRGTETKNLLQSDKRRRSV